MRMAPRWKTVDWSKTNDQIAAEMHVGVQTVRLYRHHLFPPTMVSEEELFEKEPEVKFWVELARSGGIGDYISQDFDRAREFYPLVSWADSLLQQTDAVIKQINYYLRRRRVAVARLRGK